VQSDFATEGNPENKNNVKFTLGGGDAKIEAHTVNGSVHIARQT